MKNFKSLVIATLLTSFTIIHASRLPHLDHEYLFRSKEHIEKRLKSINLIRITQNSDILDNLYVAQTPLDIATAIEDACSWQISLGNEVIKKALYKEFFQDYRDHLNLLREASHEGYIDIQIPNIIPHQK